MSAPYRNFWIIVGMTVSACVLANISSRSNVPNATQAAAPSAISKSGSTTSVDQSVSKASEAPTPLPAQTSARQIRSIEPDLKMAFDVAINEALAKKPDSIPGAATANSDTAPAPAPLITKQVKSTPEVAEVPMVGTADEKPARTTTNLNMRQGPGAKFTLVEALPTGTLVAVLKEEAGWVYIRVIETGQNGWVNMRFLRRD